MLYSVDTQKYVSKIPHEAEYRAWTDRMSEVERDGVFAELNKMIEGNEIHTSSWMPGSDWSDTAFRPIYETACRMDEESSGMCFGLMLWDVLMQRQEVWGFGRYEKDGVAIAGMTYFRIDNPPHQ